MDGHPPRNRPAGGPARKGLRGEVQLLTTAGIFQVPFKIEGVVSFGQYILIIGMNSPFGAGSQLASLSAPGDATWK
jgi:hypothetical protein